MSRFHFTFLKSKISLIFLEHDPHPKHKNIVREAFYVLVTSCIILFQIYKLNSHFAIWKEQTFFLILNKKGQFDCVLHAHTHLCFTLIKYMHLSSKWIHTCTYSCCELLK